MKVPRILLTILACLIVLGGGFAVARHLIKTKPGAARAERETPATLVEVAVAELTSEPTYVVGNGTVIPARELAVTPEVTGLVIDQSDKLVPGGIFDEGEKILEIDDRDYKAILEQKLSLLEDARFNLKVEEGQQVIAKREWELLNKDMDENDTARDLALRKPHLTRAKAALESARSAADKAQLDVDRTKIHSPFNAIVIDESVEKWQRVTQQTRVATLVGTDYFWVRVSVPFDRLESFDLPDKNGENGAHAAVIQQMSGGREVRRDGRVVRLLGDLDPVGRMARVLVEVKDPLSREKKGSDKLPPLLLGDFVRVRIDGRKIDDVVVLPGAALHDGDKVWIMDHKGQLEIRRVPVAWRRSDAVLVKDAIKPGERIVISRIPTPVPKMPLRTAKPSGEESGAGSSGKNVEPGGSEDSGQ